MINVCQCSQAHGVIVGTVLCTARSWARWSLLVPSNSGYLIIFLCELCRKRGLPHWMQMKYVLQPSRPFCLLPHVLKFCLFKTTKKINLLSSAEWLLREPKFQIQRPCLRVIKLWIWVSVLIKDLDITFCSSVNLLGKSEILKPISAVLLGHFNLQLILLFLLHSTFVFTGLAYVMSEYFSFFFFSFLCNSFQGFAFHLQSCLAP